MRFCWDNIEGLYLTNRGNFKKGSNTYIYKPKCLKCTEPFLTVKSVNSNFCSKKCVFKYLYNECGKIPPFTGRSHTDGYKNKMRTIRLGKNNPFYGKTHSDRFKRDMSKRVLDNPPMKSLKARLKISKAKSGDKHHNWQGGKTTENDRIRHSREYKEWRRLVFVRDKYKCRACNKKGGELNAHHIQFFNSNKELRFEVENGVTMCKDCHVFIHFGGA
jgi:hypothetical protein